MASFLIIYLQDLQDHRRSKNPHISVTMIE